MEYMTLEQVETLYRCHHTAATRGYMSRKTPYFVAPYSGRFGAGYVVHRPRWDTTQYHWVDYYTIPKKGGGE